MEEQKITHDGDNQEMYRKLLAIWLSESKPGFVIKGSLTYKVMMKDDRPEFWLYDTKNAYESRSFGN